MDLVGHLNLGLEFIFKLKTRRNPTEKPTKPEEVVLTVDSFGTAVV